MIRGIDVARTQLGVTEATGNNDGTPAERYNRGDALPWCAALMLFCNAHSDEEPMFRTAAEFYAERVVQGFEDHCKTKGWWMPPTYRPQTGDYIFFGDRGLSDAALTGRHMGIVDTVTQDGERVVTIEGNESNACRAVIHDMRKESERKRVTGYAQIPLRVRS